MQHLVAGAVIGEVLVSLVVAGAICGTEDWATKKRENLKAILYVFADCNECVFHV